MSTVLASAVSVRLGATTALTDVELRASSSSWIGLIGPNGSGKSTLLKSIAGLVALQTGSVAIGQTILSKTGRRQWARMVSMVPQRPQIPPDMSVADYVLLGRTPHLGPLAVEGPSDLAVVVRTLGQLDLIEMAGRALGTLSGGELQRAVLARAIAQEAPILLLDEPTAALDLGHQQQVLELVEDLRRSQGLTVISAVHDLTLAAQFCDRLLLLFGGQVVAEGPPHQVLTEEAIRIYFDADVRIATDQHGRLAVIPTRSRVDATAETHLTAR